MYYSQEWIGQDKFVAETLNYKQNGTFLDIGCHHYSEISNTYYLEKELNWSGIGVDIDCSFKQHWENHRKNSIFVCENAVTTNYDELLRKYNMPKIIDYLTIDLEPPQLAFHALKKLFETDYVFSVVTFETDAYRQLETRDVSRELFKSRGYVFIQEINQQDDFYIHSSLME
jgi:hypothetical protein